MVIETPLWIADSSETTLTKSLNAKQLELAVLAGSGWFWMVLGGSGWFWVVPVFSTTDLMASCSFYVNSLVVTIL